MNNNANNNNNPYGHFLDKYLEPTHLEWKERQKREGEAKTRYGDLLDKVKPGISTFDLIMKMEDECIERRKKMEEKERLESLQRQMRIENARRKEEEHNAEVRGYAESIMAKKEAKRLAAEKEIAEKRKAEEKQKEIYDRIDGLMKISPEAANAYIWALKQGNVI